VPAFADALKRLLVGRPVHRERSAETLLPKRIALPVFASDAPSSVAYAPDEIFLTLAAAPGQTRRGLVGQGALRDGDVADQEPAL
jgi:hypothetical protein